MKIRPAKEGILNRFTSLPVLLDMLVKKKIILSSPTFWEDANDSFYIQNFKLKKKLKTILALCFTKGLETFHHWKIFSYGNAGVCVEFDKKILLDYFVNIKGIRSEMVKYRSITNLEANPPDLNDWPFLKRLPYKDENEFRIIYENKNECEETKEIHFDVECIRRITLSPWLQRHVSETIKNIIKNIDGCGGLKVYRSTLLDNSRWRNAVSNQSLPEKI